MHDVEQARQTARTVALRHRQAMGGVISCLREIVGECGHVSPDQAEQVAHVFNLSRAEVRGILSFYHDLRTQPPPPATVRLCQAEACQSVGSRQLTERVQERLGIEMGEANESVALLPVYCLGLCAQGPAAEVNGRPLARADALDLDTWLPS